MTMHSIRCTSSRRLMVAATCTVMVAAAACTSSQGAGDVTSGSGRGQPGSGGASTAGTSSTGAARPVPAPSTAISGHAVSADAGVLLSAPEVNGSKGILIATAAGKTVYWKPAPAGRTYGDLHTSTYLGKPVLVYFDGTGGGHYQGSWHIMDDTYHDVATISAGNGAEADLHDMLLRSDGTAVVEAYVPVTKDLSADGGKKDAIVLESQIQTVDVATKKVLTSWSSLSDFPVTDTFEDLTGGTIDYMHTNSLAVDPTDPDAVIVSARNISQVFKLDLITGEVEWKLGGRRPTLALQPGATDTVTIDGAVLPFTRVHDGQMLPDGTVRVFDNGSDRPTQFSSVNYYSLDLGAKTATEQVPRKIRAVPDIYGSIQGNAAELPGGSTFVSWGNTGTAGIYGANRHVLTTIKTATTYRMYLQPWSATPTTAPTAVATTSAPGLTVIATWNGATEVANWKLLAGPSAQSLTVRKTAKWTGKSTSLTGLPIADGQFVAVRALDAAGKTLQQSAAVKVE
ncbi:MAG: arylsulfotransferase family protein [Nakamurella sp.]